MRKYTHTHIYAYTVNTRAHTHIQCIYEVVCTVFLMHIQHRYIYDHEDKKPQIIPRHTSSTSISEYHPGPQSFADLQQSSKKSEQESSSGTWKKGVFCCVAPFKFLPKTIRLLSRRPCPCPWCLWCLSVVSLSVVFLPLEFLSLVSLSVEFLSAVVPRTKDHDCSLRRKKRTRATNAKQSSEPALAPWRVPFPSSLGPAL